LTQMPELADKVELLERSANDLQDLAEDSFDTVIINSVAQYFPNAAYLNRVMENAIRAIKPGGHLFMGDKRSLPLLETFALSVEANEAPPEITVAELRERVRSRTRQEQELLLSPTFFLSASRRFPKVSGVDIYPRRGTRDNEMSRFRYDAILRIGTPPSRSTEIPFLNPPERGWTIDEIRSQLSGTDRKGVGFTRIGNSRLAPDARLLARVAVADPKEAFTTVRGDLGRVESSKIHPEAIAQLGADAGYEVALSWASCHPEGSYDAAFLPRRPAEGGLFPHINWPQPRSSDFVFSAISPGQAEFREKLVGELASYCRAQLPAESVPERVYIVDSLPTEDDDCRSLLAMAWDPVSDLSRHRSLL
jgi:hypothetical protein